MKQSNSNIEIKIESADIKATGNADFEHHNYPSALLWYTLGIAFELNNPYAF